MANDHSNTRRGLERHIASSAHRVQDPQQLPESYNNQPSPVTANLSVGTLAWSEDWLTDARQDAMMAKIGELRVELHAMGGTAALHIATNRAIAFLVAPLGRPIRWAHVRLKDWADQNSISYAFDSEM